MICTEQVKFERTFGSTGFKALDTQSHRSSLPKSIPIYYARQPLSRAHADGSDRSRPAPFQPPTLIGRSPVWDWTVCRSRIPRTCGRLRRQSFRNCSTRSKPGFHPSPSYPHQESRTLTNRCRPTGTVPFGFQAVCRVPTPSGVASRNAPAHALGPYGPHHPGA